MAKKAKTFAEKALGKKANAPLCPKCGGAYTPLMLVKSEKKDENNEWRFVRSIVKVCKCNEKEVYA